MADRFICLTYLLDIYESQCEFRLRLGRMRPDRNPGQVLHLAEWSCLPFPSPECGRSGFSRMSSRNRVELAHKYPLSICLTWSWGVILDYDKKERMKKKEKKKKKKEKRRQRQLACNHKSDTRDSNSEHLYLATCASSLSLSIASKLPQHVPKFNARQQ